MSGLQHQRYGRALRAAQWFFDRNDPCDEWPRHLIYAAVGLQACGCPLKPAICACPESSGVQACQLGMPWVGGNYYDHGHYILPKPGLGD